MGACVLVISNILHYSDIFHYRYRYTNDCIINQTALMEQFQWIRIVMHCDVVAQYDVRNCAYQLNKNNTQYLQVQQQVVVAAVAAAAAAVAIIVPIN